MKIVYIADDGKEFDTEKECKEYEDNRPDIKKLIWDEVLIGYDQNGVILEYNLADPDFTDEDWLENVFYMRVTRGLTKKEINDFYIEYGFNLPFTTKGLYRYDWESSSWISYEEDYANFKKKWKRFEEGGN